MSLEYILKEGTVETKIFPAERELLLKYWDEKKIISTDSWYVKIMQGIDREGLIALFNEIINADFKKYRPYLGDPHLDIGSGTLATPLLIHNETCHEVYCLDIYDSDILPDARQMLAADSKFHFNEYKPDDNLPYTNGIMGSASLFYVLHHCSNQVEARHQALELLKEAKRVIKKGGYLVVIEEPVFAESDYKRRVEIDIAANKLFHPEGFGENFDPGSFYREDELKQQFRESGFNLQKEIIPDAWQWLIPRKIYILKSI